MDKDVLNDVSIRKRKVVDGDLDKVLNDVSNKKKKAVFEDDPDDALNTKNKGNGIWNRSDHLYPSGNVSVASPLDCLVEKVLVKDGMDVEEGQPMFVFTVEVPYSLPHHLSRTKKYLEDVSVDQDDVECSPIARLDNEDVLERYKNFKKFDIVVDHSDHLFSGQTSAMPQAKNWVSKIQDEWRILEQHLPENVFVRVYKSRMDLLRFAIVKQIRPMGRGGIFVFDVFFPSTYPNRAPFVHYYSAGSCINLSLNLGEVHLNCKNSGGWEEMGLLGTGNIIHLLRYIQYLVYSTTYDIMDLEYESIMRGNSVYGEICVLQTYEIPFIRALKTMAYTMNKPPKNFEDLVVGYFRNHARDILVECKAAMEELQNTYLLQQGNKEGIIKLNYDLTSCIKALVYAFNNVGAKVAEEFLPLSENRTLLPDAASSPTFENHYHLCTFVAPTALSVVKVLVKDKMAVHEGQPLFVSVATKMEGTVANSSSAEQSDFSEDKVHLTKAQLAMCSEITNSTTRRMLNPEDKPWSELDCESIWRRLEKLKKDSRPHTSRSSVIDLGDVFVTKSSALRQEGTTANSSSAIQSDFSKDKVPLTKAQQLAICSKITNATTRRMLNPEGKPWSELDCETIGRRLEKLNKDCRPHTSRSSVIDLGDVFVAKSSALRQEGTTANSSSATQLDFSKDKVPLTKAQQLAICSKITNATTRRMLNPEGKPWSEVDCETIWRRLEKLNKDCCPHTS